jgi:hypothetical protein
MSLSDESRSRIGFWLLIAMISAVGVGKAVLSDTFDPDLFWHLRVAEQLRHDGIGPLVDSISFQSTRTPWTPYSWLAELVMEWLWNTFGYRATIVVEAFMVAAILALVAKSCLDFAGPERKLNGVVATAFAAYLSIPFLSFRPITMAIVLLAIVAWLLLRDRARGENTRAVWLIVPITLLLANVHLSVIVAPLWIGCGFVGAIVERDRRAMKRYGLMLALVALASIATPMLPGAIRTAWFYQSADVMVASDVIAEMRSIFAGWAGTINLVLLGVLLVFALAHRQRLRVAEWLMLLGTGVLMVRLGRFAPIFALIAAPILSRTMPPLKDRVLARPLIVPALACSLLLFVSRIVLGFPWNQPMDAWMNRRGTALPGYPAEAAAYVEANISRRTGRLINEFNWGGYLAWRLKDRYQVFLDGRTQLYTPDFWRTTYLGPATDAGPILTAADADAAIVPIRKSRFADVLIDLGWRTAHEDKFARVLVPPADKKERRD